MRRTGRHGFTLTELLVVIGIVCLLISIILPMIARTRHSGGRMKCPSNLRQIGQAIQMYANDNKGNFPRTVSDGVGGPPTEYTAPLAPHPFQPGGPGPNDVTAVLFLLVRTQDITPEVFICPSVRGAEPWDFGGAGRTAQNVSNFPSRQFLTYSYANPYWAPAVSSAANKVICAPYSDFALAADMNPGGPAVLSVTPASSRAAVTAANSPNHAGDGQNVLYADGHVEFQNTPFAGKLRTPGDGSPPYRDNIYTPGETRAPGAGVRGGPVDRYDSVLLPTALDGPAPSPAESPASQASMSWLWGGTSAALVALVVLSAALTHRRARKARPPA